MLTLRSRGSNWLAQSCAHGVNVWHRKVRGPKLSTAHRKEAPITSLAVATCHHIVSLPDAFPPILFGIVLISIFWTGWDRTYATVRRYQFQGRAVRVYGKQQYNVSLRSKTYLRSLSQHTNSLGRPCNWWPGLLDWLPQPCCLYQESSRVLMLSISGQTLWLAVRASTQALCWCAKLR